MGKKNTKHNKEVTIEKNNNKFLPFSKPKRTNQTTANENKQIQNNKQITKEPTPGK